MGADLGARAAGLERAVAAANGELQAALLNGADTGAIRVRLAALAAESAEVVAAMGAEQIAAARAMEAKISADASDLARAVAGRLRARLAALEPPPVPGRA